MWIGLVAALLAATGGFCAGFVTFKRSQRWCPGCGTQITPAHCPHLIGTAAGTVAPPLADRAPVVS